MSVAKISEISSSSSVSFDDAIRKGIERANRTLKNVQGAWISEQKVDVQDGVVSNYRVMMKITFVLEG